MTVVYSQTLKLGLLPAELIFLISCFSSCGLTVRDAFRSLSHNGMVKEFLTYFPSHGMATSAVENVFKWVSVMLSTNFSFKASCKEKEKKNCPKCKIIFISVLSQTSRVFAKERCKLPEINTSFKTKSCQVLSCQVLK